MLKDLVTAVKNIQSVDKNVLGIGVSMPGVVQADGFLTTSGAVKCFTGINLAQLLEKKQGNKREKIKEDQILVFLKMIIYLSSLSNFSFTLSTVSLTASLASDSLSLALPRIP